jgi:hydroxypyruvate isomerase
MLLSPYAMMLGRMKFSANLGFLWADRSLPEAIRAAKAAGFDAVECHWPYAVPAADVKAALDETGLTMIGLNTSRGDTAAGENGLPPFRRGATPAPPSTSSIRPHGRRRRRPRDTG